MGGSGGGFIPPPKDIIQKKIEKAREEERERLETDVNQFLQNLLARLNDRDAEATQQKISNISDKISDLVEIQQFLFGGSVAKHTYVDGLSDVDALAILNRRDLEGKSPQEMLKAFYKNLKNKLTFDNVESVQKGKLAVTVKYRDGFEIQILPALRSGNKVLISDASGESWKETKPKTFQRLLSKSNEKVNFSLVPAIKLMKSIISDFPKQKQLTGYHVESLAVGAIKNYQGPSTQKAVLTHLIDHAAKRVLRPIQDKTGQSRIVDGYLGKADSAERHSISRQLSLVKRRLETSTSLAQWKAMFGE